MSQGTNLGGQVEKGRTRRNRACLRAYAVRIDGFRAVRDLSLELDPDLTVLLGENNSGKSTVLEALGVALGGMGAVEEDLHLPLTGERLAGFTVDVALCPEDGEGFDGYTAAVLGNAVQRSRSGLEYAGIRAVGAPAGDGSGITVTRKFFRSWNGSPQRLGQVETMDSPPVRRAVLELVSFTLLDAKRDLVEDLRKRRTAWGQLLARLEVPEDLAGEIASSLEELGDRVIGSSSVLRDLRAGLQAVRTALGSSVSEIALAPLPSRVEEVARAIDVLVSAPGGAAVPLRLQGMGSRSLAALMVFQSFVEMRLGADLGLEPLALTALEEPEAHLHPQAQAAVTTLLRGLPGQKIVSTHAARVATTAELHQLRFLRRTGDGIAALSTQNPPDPEVAHKVRRLVLRPNGDVLFARLVVVGDGATESDALPVFAQAYWGADPEGLGLAFPEVGGLGGPQAGALVKFLDDLGIPWIALVDGDEKGTQAIGGWEERLGRGLDRTSELVELPSGWAFERMLLETGWYEPILRGLTQVLGDRLVADTAATRGLAPDDPKVLLKVMRKHKGMYGRAVAEELVAARDGDGNPSIPPQVRELLDRAADVLGIERR